MDPAIKHLSKDSLIYGFGLFAVRGAGFLLFPVYTNFVSTDDMGRYALGVLLASLMVLLIQGGLGQAFIREYGTAGSEEERKAVFFRTFSAVCFSALSLFILLAAFRVHLAGFFFGKGYEKLILLIGAAVFFEAASQYPLLILRCRERAMLFQGIQLAGMAVQIGMALYLVMIRRMGAEGIFISQAAAFLFILILVSPLIVRHLPRTGSLKGLGSMLRFGMPHLISGLFIVVIDLSDRFLLQRMTDLHTVGIYNAGCKLAALMALAVAGFRYAWIPLIVSLDETRIRDVLSRVPTYFLLAGGWFYLFLLFFLNDLVRFQIGPVRFMGPRFMEGLSMVPWIAGAYLCYGFFILLLPGVYRARKSGGLILITGLGAWVNLAGNLWLIPLTGMKGAAVSTLAAYFLMTGWLFLYVQRLFPVQYELRRLGILLCLFIFSGAAGSLINWSRPGMARGILLLGIPLTLWLVPFFYPEERRAVRKTFSCRSRL